MGFIRTVLGDLAPEDLGYCQTHEHIMCDSNLAPFGWIQSTYADLGSGGMVLDDADRAHVEVQRYSDAGGCALVDVTTFGWGRDHTVQASIARTTGVHIIATGGFYTEPHMPRFVETRSIPELAAWIVGEFEQGIDGTDVRIGLLKSGIHHARIAGLELKGLHAVARASLETGLAITTHTSGGRKFEVKGGNLGKHHLRVLLEAGVDPSRLIVGHTDQRVDTAFLSELCSMGCYVQFDVVGKEHWMLDETRIDLLIDLINLGHVDRVLLGTDRCRKTELYQELGGVGYRHLLEDFIPRMRTRGIAQVDIDMMSIENPARALVTGGVL